jgi:hypothetical protein
MDAPLRPRLFTSVVVRADVLSVVERFVSEGFPCELGGLGPLHLLGEAVRSALQLGWCSSFHVNPRVEAVRALWQNVAAWASCREIAAAVQTNKAHELLLEAIRHMPRTRASCLYETGCREWGWQSIRDMTTHCRAPEIKAPSEADLCGMSKEEQNEFEQQRLSWWRAPADADYWAVPTSCVRCRRAY